MMCYRDMTFCSFHNDCEKAKDCHRPLTEEVRKRAADIDLPIMQYMEKPQCHSDNDKPKQ